MQIIFTPATIAIQVIVVLLVSAAIVTIALGVKEPSLSPKWLGISAAVMYLVSFLTAFSIGRYVLSLTFVLLSLAIAHSMDKGRRNHIYSLIAIIVGLALWLIIISFALEGYLI